MEIYVLNLLKNVPGVVPLLDVFMTLDGYVLVMEQPSPPVKDLREYLTGKIFRITESQARDILRQVVEIMIRLHEAGVYHQDLKLENLLIETKTGRVHIIDFGAAQLVASGPFKKFYGKWQQQFKNI